MMFESLTLLLLSLSSSSAAVVAMVGTISVNSDGDSVGSNVFSFSVRWIINTTERPIES